jgi:glutamine amidotransferase
MKNKVAVIDYDVNNVFSICKAFAQLDIYPKIVTNSKELLDYKYIVLPGVGTFASGVKELEKIGFFDIYDKLNETKPFFLGICLGMQLFLKKSEEDQNENKGLSAFDGDCRKLPSNKKTYLPHIGWNKVTITKDTYITKNLNKEFDAYFVHSYYANLKNNNNVLALTKHNITFPSIINYENFTGVQFHPEKCKKNGFEILKNFTNLK